MQKLLIIGNGFDLHHLLPTKYEHFIQTLISIETLPPSLTEYTFEQVFKNINPEFKNEISNCYHVNKIAYSNDTIKSIQFLIKSNIWYQTFKHITEIDTWIDFETQIEKILQIVNLLFEKANQFIDKNYDKESIVVSSLPTNEGYGFTVNAYQFKIINDLSLVQNVSGTGSGTKGYFNKDYLLIQNNSIYAIEEKKILEYLSDSLNQFIQIFNQYFSNIIEPFYPNFNHFQSIKDDSDQIVTIETTRDAQIKTNVNKFRSIYSFNYTPTLQKYYNAKNISYIHGQIGPNNNMVLGISDINKELKQHKMFAFTKYYQKLYKNTDYNFMENEIYPNVHTQIYIWGHSLDQSDAEYISKIINTLQIPNSLCKVIIFHHNDLARANQLQNLLSICGKEAIEVAMKKKQLIFQPSSNQNLLQMIKVSKP
jgi:hypothetical protein